MDAKQIVLLERLCNNDCVIVSLKLDHNFVGVSFDDLLQALCVNITVKQIRMDDTFLGSLTYEKARIVLQVIGGMPKLESLAIIFPNSFIHDANPIISCPSSEDTTASSKAKQLTAKTLTIASTGSTTETQRMSTASLLKSAVCGTANLREIEIFDLQIQTGKGDDGLLAQAFSNNITLQKLSLYDFDVIIDENDYGLVRKTNNDSYSRSSSFGSADDEFPSIAEFLYALGDLPILEEVEIRMKGRIFLPGTHLFSNLCSTSPSLKSLVLQNMILSIPQLRCIFEILRENTTMKRLEIWCLDARYNLVTVMTSDNQRALFSDHTSIKKYFSQEDTSFESDNVHLGTVLANVLKNNKTLETLMVSHVGLKNSGCAALTNSPKKKEPVQNLSLLGKWGFLVKEKITFLDCLLFSRFWRRSPVRSVHLSVFKVRHN